MHKIPCILHADNRIGIKLLSMVLMEGFGNAIERKIFGHINSSKERIKAHEEHIEQILNQQILGDEGGPAQWCIPMSDDGKTVGAVMLDNNHICSILNNFKILINASISYVSQQQKYGFCIPHYWDAMSIVQQQQEYSNDDIIRCQNHVDVWFQVWNELHGTAGCTNYTHMFSSGHLAEYMFKWRNL
jgi:GTPase